jgi:hypothetical protein
MRVVAKVTDFPVGSSNVRNGNSIRELLELKVLKTPRWGLARTRFRGLSR